MKPQILIPATLFLLACGAVHAQTTIEGRVEDTGGKFLPGANIYLEGTYDGTSSDREGYFTLTTRELETGVLKIDFIGYRSYSREINLKGQKVELGVIRLREAINDLNAVTITAGTFEAGDKKKSISLNSLDMVTTAGSDGDVFGALKSLPGTTPVGESGKLFVKGGDSRESKTYIDGTLVYVPYSSSTPGQSVRGRFNPFMFSGMMFSTGGYSAEYGQALSSVLALQTNAMPAQDQLNISLLSVGGEIGGTKTWDDFSLTSTLSCYNLTPYMRLLPQNVEWDTEPRSYSGDLSLRWRTGNSGMLKLYATANRSRMATMEESLENPDHRFRYQLVNDNFFLNSSWAGEAENGWILSAGFSVTCNTDHIRYDTVDRKEQLWGSHAKFTVKRRFNDHVRVLAGSEFYSKNYGYLFPGTETHPTEAYLNQLVTGFLESELYASKRWVTRIGIRTEYSGYLGRSSLAPRISTAYKLSDRSQLSTAYGWFFQDPQDKYLLCTDQLDFERADHLTLNYILSADRRVLRTELYYKDYKKLVKFDDPGSGGYGNISNAGHGYAYGLDLFWRDRKSLGSGEYWISYSWIESRREYLDYPHEAIPGFTSRHNLSVVYKHFIQRLRSQAGISCHFSSPRTYDDPNTEAFNDRKTLPYRSLDLNWSYLLKQHLIIHFSVSNALGLEQSFGRRYAAVPDSEGIYRSKPVLPGSKRFFIVGCFLTLSRSGDLNQLDKIN